MSLQSILMDLFPPGAFPGLTDVDGLTTFFADWCEMDADAIQEAQDVVDQLELEILPQTAEETLDEWEAALKLDVVETATATRQALVKAAASAALAFTPANLRSQVSALLNSQYGFWDHGAGDVLAHYDVTQGNGSVTEIATGLVLQGTSPAVLDWTADTAARAEVPIVDPADQYTFEAEVQAAVVNQDTATGIYLRHRDNAIFCSVEDIGGAGVRIHAVQLQDGTFTSLGDIAVPATPYWLQIIRQDDGAYQFLAGTLGSMTSIVADVALTWTPNRFGVHARTDAAGRTVVARYQDIRIAYVTSRNNVELHEFPAHIIPAGNPEVIFFAFVHRDPNDTGNYELGATQRSLDRICWGHALIIVGLSDNFLCDDPNSLTDRDILGV